MTEADRLNGLGPQAMTDRVYRRFMTEKWLTTTDVEAMVHWAADVPLEVGERKLRLFAAACCRRVWRLLPDAATRRLVEACERFADGLATASELHEALERSTPSFGVRRRTPRILARWAAWWAAGECQVPPFASLEICLAVHAAGYAAKAAGLATPGGEAAERQAQAALLRDIVGDPLRLTRADPAWLSWQGGVVVGLARAAYDEQQLPQGTLDPARLRVLADALEEAGADADLVEHLRGFGPHHRGCHAVDLLTGRE